MKDSIASGYVKAALRSLDPKCLLPHLDGIATQRMTCLLLWLAYCGWGRIHVVAGRRDLDQQCQLYGQGRTAAECMDRDVPCSYAKPAMQIVTWCNPYNSRHVRGLAIDVDLLMYAQVSYPAFGSLVRKAGFTWGGDWDVRDYGHIEIG